MILQTSHGRRSIDMLRVLAPHKANWEYVCDMEGRIPRLYGSSAVEIPGARALLTAVTDAEVPWAIVTSGTVPLVTGWIKALDLPRPPPTPTPNGRQKERKGEENGHAADSAKSDNSEGLVTAESVANGKPDPECYILGRERLGFELGLEGAAAADLLVLEDSPAGIRAGRAAGCRVLGLVTSHTLDQVLAAEPDWVVANLESVRVAEVVETEGSGGVRRRKVVLEFSGLLGGTAVDRPESGEGVPNGAK